MISFGFYSYPVNLSCNLPDIIILTDHDYVDFKMKSQAHTLLEGRFYAYNDEIVITDIASLVENVMINNHHNNLANVCIEATFNGEEEESIELSFKVLYCDKTISTSNTEQWLKENYLTISRNRRIAENSFINLAWYATVNESIEVRICCIYTNRSDEISTFEFIKSGEGSVASEDGIQTTRITIDEICNEIKKATDQSDIRLQTVTVRCGDRSESFYIDPALAGIVPFYYLNCFGVPEHIALPRTTTEKIKSDRSIALLENHSQFYDISHSKEFEVETGGLSRDECVQVEQMLTSPSVRIPWGRDVSVFEMDFDALLSILISDYTSEISDSDEKLNSVKFTWRFAHNRPKVELPYSPGIFNNKFNHTFS